jgi:hypothetical protein
MADGGASISTSRAGFVARQRGRSRVSEPREHLVVDGGGGESSGDLLNSQASIERDGSGARRANEVA